ncbi:SusD/RagB family nutrient-binding outer membrane lipoprotein [Anaerophaga thermohalophila]|uniref:SusD/RagB family nutrient-binding outer membrane lipoprotein n=1 Tax=Anaerophaga thermohalophila TaxID=177400 RepID=UPI000237D1FF|nr:SusD/RagB family nutrient-binding outer membrane lipoprotein [Anaerophaga thermohalophila]
MKKILIYFIMIPVLLLSSSCEEWMDVNTDPNTPEDVPVELILPAAEASIATRVGGNMFNFAGFFTQYWTQAPEANQYNKIDNYDINAPFLNSDYTELYAGALNDLEAVRTKALEDNQTGYVLIATVLQAYTFQVWVDLIGDIPYSEALMGVENKSPKYDDGQSVYEDLIASIDEALNNLEADAYVSPTDYLFGGDLDKWVAFANSLKLKIYMRASYAVDYSAEIQSLIQEDNFITSDVAFAAWNDEPNRYNPWYGTNAIGLGTVNNVAALPIINFLKNKFDVRLPLLFTTVNDDFIGAVPAMKEDMTADFSHPIIDAVQPVYFLTMSELELFKSEAYLRFFNDDTKAMESYENAIDHSLALHGLSTDGEDLYGEGAPYEWDSTAGEEDKIKQIAMQKWVSLCLVNNFEAWNEMRRLGYPEYTGANANEVYNGGLYTAGTLISPSGNALGQGNFIQRLPFPEESTRLNDNAPQQKNLTENIWWDQK